MSFIYSKSIRQTSYKIGRRMEMKIAKLKMRAYHLDCNMSNFQALVGFHTSQQFAHSIKASNLDAKVR